MSATAYTQMQKAYYESEIDPNTDVVGSFDWHENFPYETLLLHEDGDIRKPIFPSLSGLRALDFACGPGRMVARMSKLFAAVGGVDISNRLVNVARQRCPSSNFWVASGADLGDAPLKSYDFIYRTIAIQHIAVHDIRERIFYAMKDRLRSGGKVTLQMAYSTIYPFRRTTRNYEFGPMRVEFLKKEAKHAEWNENKLDATVTNGYCDVAITQKDLPVI